MGVVGRGFVNDFSVYAGYIALHARRRRPTRTRDPLGAERQPARRRGRARASGTRPTSRCRSATRSAPPDDDSQLSSSPVWAVDQIEWERLGGRTAGTTTADEVTLGELRSGKGVVRVVGALLPMPTEQYYHPFGLANYAVTYSGYQVLQNALQWERPLPDLAVAASGISFTTRQGPDDDHRDGAQPRHAPLRAASRFASPTTAPRSARCRRSRRSRPAARRRRPSSGTRRGSRATARSPSPPIRPTRSPSPTRRTTRASRTVDGQGQQGAERRLPVVDERRARQLVELRLDELRRQRGEGRAGRLVDVGPIAVVPGAVVRPRASTSPAPARRSCSSSRRSASVLASAPLAAALTPLAGVTQVRIVLEGRPDGRHLRQRLALGAAPVEPAERRVGFLVGALPAAPALPVSLLHERRAGRAGARTQGTRGRVGLGRPEPTGARSCAISGQELVPVLVDGDRVIADSTAILEHLEERFPERPLYPADPARRAELRLFVDWFNQVWKRPPNLIVDEEAKAEPDRARIAELEALDRRRAAALRGAARRPRLPLRPRALRRRRRRVPVPQVRAALGGGRPGPLPRGAARHAAPRRPLPAARGAGSGGSTRCPAPDAVYVVSGSRASSRSSKSARSSSPVVSTSS